MKDNEGKREGSVLAFSDVTELAEALNAKDDFLSSVSHELRTPLTSIRGYTELLLLDTNLPPQVTAGLTVIDRNADQLLKLVTDLLGTATGFADLQPVEADLADLLKQAATAAEPRAAASGVVLSLDAPEPLMVECDPARIRQVLDNLLSNAVKYSPDGGTVTVRGGVRDGVVYGEVADTGMGMATEESGSIFTKFFRTSTARMSSIPGVGLGLPLSKDIVERHGGSIWCTSAPGAGSVFTFTLPRWTDGVMPGGTAGGNQ
jgi:two-component system, OmpR family, phosphate regulon sensor histidine kinase PhoR